MIFFEFNLSSLKIRMNEWHQRALWKSYSTLMSLYKWFWGPTDTTNHFDALPRDIVVEILQYIKFGGKNWLNIKLVNKKWFEASCIAFNPNTVRALERMIDRMASEQVVLKLLQDERVDPTIFGFWPMRWACMHGYLDIVEKLLKDLRLRPVESLFSCLQLASEYGHLHIVHRLLEDDRIDPTECENAAITIASRNGHVEIVKRLLKDVRIISSDQFNSGFQHSRVEKFKKLLMSE